MTGFVADTSRPEYLADERFDGALTNWANVQQHAGGTATGLPYCGEKISAASAVTYTYGTIAGYQQRKPYIATWREKRGSGYWEPKSSVARSYADEAALSTVQIAWPVDAEALLIDHLQIRQMSTAEYAAYSDAMLARDFPGVRPRPNTDSARFDPIPNTMATLRNGGTIRIALMGDSYRNFISTMPWEALIGRAYPLANIWPQIAALGSTGADSPLITEGAPDVPFYGWDSDSRISGMVAPATPDLIIFGGISSTYGLSPGFMSYADSLAHWAGVIAKLREYIPGVEIIISSRANGIWETSEYVRAVAAANNVAYYDESAFVRQFCTDAGVTPEELISSTGGWGGDDIHFGPPGRNMGAQGLAAWFGAQ